MSQLCTPPLVLLNPSWRLHFLRLDSRHLEVIPCSSPSAPAPSAGMRTRTFSFPLGSFPFPPVTVPSAWQGLWALHHCRDGCLNSTTMPKTCPIVSRTQPVWFNVTFKVLMLCFQPHPCRSPVPAAVLGLCRSSALARAPALG